MANMLTSFAHLIGAKRAPSAKKAEDDKEDQRARLDGESDDDYDARMAELDEEEDKAKKASKAKKATKAEDGDEDGEDDEGDDNDAKAARVRERARCAAIFAHPSAAKNVPLAASLAFNTSLPRSQAIALLHDGSAAVDLEDATAPRRSGKQALTDRMLSAPKPTIGAGVPQLPSSEKGEASALAARMASAYNKANGKTA